MLKRFDNVQYFMWNYQKFFGFTTSLKKYEKAVI